MAFLDVKLKLGVDKNINNPTIKRTINIKLVFFMSCVNLKSI